MRSPVIAVAVSATEELLILPNEIIQASRAVTSIVTAPRVAVDRAQLPWVQASGLGRHLPHFVDSLVAASLLAVFCERDPRRDALSSIDLAGARG